MVARVRAKEKQKARARIYLHINYTRLSLKMEEAQETKKEWCGLLQATAQAALLLARSRDGGAGFSGDGGGSSGEFLRRFYTAWWGPSPKKKTNRNLIRYAPDQLAVVHPKNLISSPVMCKTAMASPDFFSGDVQNLISSLSTEEQNCEGRHYRGSLRRRRGSLLLR
ncbi:hypothetical protein MRB53_022178 [Persea americana]|uniref:Uncharacterized protein n=1 Tax=Persea americana TaxID=3435 RepID=A0ACC2L685_PERAE|nr:hypothetical protein MRB53_022178 [Persea americana]